ncbi:GDP-perosamine synthase [Paenibacillus plantiphilus]|uniref:GDP-perosamine synthase n=1 Tax=Paenibacillus plantiphilus TaxID=2905650 RepID=A0ABM9BRH9_9BACL|nr:LegC family aminotransferase [Paenibacillus plantiphilus]CAH1192922.1 GDP-perosamine synthase [Paenibacillus plantiphilus]
MTIGTFEKQIIRTIRSVIAVGPDATVALHEPSFKGNEWKYIKDCIDTGWVSSVGKYVDLFERKLEQFTGAKHAVAVVNGTAALHICLLLAGVKAGDEVLVPSLSFVATANAVTYSGAIPHFADVDHHTLGLDVQKLDHYLKDIAILKHDGCYNRRTNRRIKAVVPMHTFGQPVDIESLIELVHHYKIELIEDAAESLGSYYKGKHTGLFGKMGAISFNGNKIITTGGGGAIITNDSEIAKAAKHLTTTAKIPHKWEYDHDSIGYNYRMPNINAALGCAQMEELPNFIKSKRELAKKYRSAFKNVSGVHLYTEQEWARSNYWLNVLFLGGTVSRDDLLESAANEGLMLRPIWKPLHLLSMYKECPAMELETTLILQRQIINIPSGPTLG